MLTAWALVLIYFLVEHLARVKVMGVLLVPGALIALAIAQLSFEPTGGEAVADVLDSWRVGIHVVIINLGNAGYAIAAAASLIYLVQEAQLKRHTTNVFFRRLPSLASADRLARRAIALAYPAYSAGILLGTLRAVEFDVESWYLDLRVVLAVTVWLVFGAYLLLRSRTEASGRSMALLCLAGFVVVVILAVVARTLPSGFHIFGGG
jgi:ABC-type transport system involved in cytochrome c biogenesis permease subunit